MAARPHYIGTESHDETAHPGSPMAKIRLEAVRPGRIVEEPVVLFSWPPPHRRAEAVMQLEAPEISGLLRRWSAGDPQARDQLIPLVYDRLHQLAHQRLRGAPGEYSLNTTALVHEAYIRLVDAPEVDLPDRAHFLALASQVMRNLLVDRARARVAAKRGGGETLLELDETQWMSDEDLDAVAELDEALTRLEALSPRQGRMLELRYFGGLSLEETAAALNVSLATVKRELRSARAWLALELKGEPLSRVG
jgi:RNA polymerase sigma factor (TIGR02999 family)